MRPIYLDNHATTRTDSRVMDAMLPYFTEQYGNAASRHHPFGWAAKDAVDRARDQIARLIGAAAPHSEIIFTSGATEANNLALKGIVGARGPDRSHIITQRTEHKAVLDACAALNRQGVRLTILDVDGHGRVDPAAVANAINDDTVLVSIMLANNEVGSIQPVDEIGAITSAHDVLFHCDATQGVGRTDFDVRQSHADLVSLSAHKIYGPKGVGALYVRGGRPRVRLQMQMDGGGHERGRRSGTLPTPLIVGFGEAAALLTAEGKSESDRLRQMRDAFFRRLSEAVPDTHLNGPGLNARHPGNLNVSFEGVEAEALIMTIKEEVAVSTGSACTSAQVEPSHVLAALGLDESRIFSAVRFGLGRFNTDDELVTVTDILVAAVDRLRAIAEA